MESTKKRKLIEIQNDYKTKIKKLSKTKQEDEPLINTVQKMAKDVYNSLGPGHTESVYHRAMEVELRNSGIKYASEVLTPIHYKNTYVGYGRADIVVNDSLVIELKAMHKRIGSNEINRIKTYMNSLNIEEGIIINFIKENDSDCIFDII